MTATMPAFDAKQAGQEQSLFTLGLDDDANFMDAVARIPAGATFTVNDIRADLDFCEVPPSARAGLFRTACARGLCEPVTVDYHGRPVPVKIPSTGASAHAALVQVYRRPRAVREGR